MVKIQPAEIYNDPLVDSLQEAASEVLARNEGFKRRKNSIASVTSGILQALNLVAVVVGVTNPAIAIALGIAVALVETVYHAASKGAITPSGVEELKEQVIDKITQPEFAPVTATAPAAGSYSGPTVTE